VSEKAIPPTLPAGALESPQDRALREATWPLSIGHFVLGLSVALPWERRRSLLDAAQREGGVALALVALVFGFPLFLGARGVVAALGRSAPGKLTFWLPSLALFLTSALVTFEAGILAIGSARFEKIVPSESVSILVLAVLVGLLIVRAARREGFARWSHLQAAAAVVAAQLAASLRFIDEDNLVQQAGPRLVTGTAVAMIPVALWVLWQGMKKPR
jgi:hypothetical protein